MVTIEKFRNQSGNVYATLAYSAGKNYLLMRWTGYCSEDEVKLASVGMMNWQKKEGHSKKCRFHVHDTKELQGAWIGVVDWIRDEMWPFCYQYGLRYNISITSPDLFSKMSSLALRNQRSTQVTTVLFETLGAAENWLTEKYKSL